MKKAFLFFVINSMSIVFLFAQEAPSFKDAKMNLAYTQYIQLKDALVASNLDEAKKASGQLQQTLLSLNNKKATGNAEKIADSSNLDDQRLAFSELSNEMNKLVKANKPISGTLYLEYCPMANNDAGAYWLSNDKEIKNPYFGSMMLKCGMVKETIH